jgi:wyosine [tRNA(Phe)-imidazoG37] synthetase (radical SAM superfamily)
VVSSIIYGPVPSWRLGRSLGVDLLPPGGKTCTFDCIYCQLGRTARRLTQRAEFVPLDTVRRELERVRGVAADYVTFAGTGEPTLASNLGEAIRLARAILGLPVAVLTNSSLMAREDVRRDLACADTVVASLDAPNEQLFRRINRPVAALRLEDILRGIDLFEVEYGGVLALEVNTPLRPCAVVPLTASEIAAIRDEFTGLPVRSVYEAARPAVAPLDVGETLRRRPAANAPGLAPRRPRRE